jgi:hypothetical protein
MKEKAYLPLLIATTALIGGCKSTTISSFMNGGKPSANDIYNGTVAFCQMPFDTVTKYVGNSPTQSPDERKASKDRVWNAWQEQKQETKQNLDGKSFTVTNPAGFSRYDEATGLMKLYAGGHARGKYSTKASAIPEVITFNTLDNWFISPKLPGGWKHNHIKNASSEFVALSAFGKSQTGWNRSTYVINNYERPNYERQNAYYSGIQVARGIYTGNLMSVGFDTKQWYERAESPIVLKDGTFYFDSNKVNFYETFGIYPDIGTPYINISYTFEFSGCSRGQLQADVKEISVSNLAGDKEIYKVTL